MLTKDFPLRHLSTRVPWHDSGVVLWNEPNASHRRLIVTEDEPNGGISSQNIAKLIRDILR